MAKYPKVDFVQDNDRYSFVWFINTDLEAVAECLPSCRPESGPPKYEPQCYWSFFEWYMKRTLVYYDDLTSSEVKPLTSER